MIGVYLGNMLGAETTNNKGRTPSTLVFDNFNRADNAALGTATSGQTWTVAGMGIIGNAAAKTSGTSSIAFISGGSANGSVQFTEAALGEGANFYGLIFRRLDNANYWRLVVQQTSLFLQKVVASSPTTMGSVTITRSVGNVYRAAFSGSNIYCYVNGVLRINVSDAFNQTSTSHGLITANTTDARMDNFLVR